MASFEKTLQFDPLPEIPPIEDFISPLEDISEEYFEETFIGLLPESSIDPVMNPLATPSILQLKQQPPSLSITENHLLKHSVPTKLPLQEKCSPKTETYKIFSETEQEEPTNINPPTPLYQINQEKTTLKLFEVFPELSISPADFPSEPTPLATTPPIIPPTAPPVSQSVTATPVVRMIRLEVPLRPLKSKHRFQQLPLRTWEKIQCSPPNQHKTAKPVVDLSVTPDVDIPVTPDKNIDQITPPVNTGLTTPPVTELSLPLTKPLSAEPTLTESPSTNSSLPENKPNTLPFPFRESLTVETKHSHEKRGTWRLIWQSHWPEYLKSLELAASDQICFLADHLEIQKEQKRSVVSFNSFQPGDGCTTLALCAARELAERGYRILLVDAHQQNPELPQLLHLQTNPDFYEIITLIPDRLELLPWSETSIEINTNNPITQSFTEIVGSFRDDYDFILLDNGSLVESPLDQRVIHWREMRSDGVLLILNMKSPPSVNIQTIAQRFLQNQVRLLGIVENYV
jgi:Mrp family chromosome partitioning ATPase